MDNNKEQQELEKWAAEGLEAYEKNSSLDELELKLQKKFDTRINQSDNKAKPRSRKLWMLLTPIISVAAVAIILLWPSTNNMSQLFNDHYNTMPQIFDVSERGSQTPGENNFLTAGMDLYHTNDFSKAIESLKKANSDDLQILYLGLSYLGTDNSDKSIGLLKQIQNSEFKDVKDWYLALAYLKNQDKVKSLQLLKAIVDSKDHYKKTEATLLIEKLK